jgi:transketolase
MKEILQPISRKCLLAGNPNPRPIHRMKVQSLGGEVEVSDPRAVRALVALMDMNAVMGGAASHYGGPAAFAELMSALHGFVFTEAARNSFQWYDRFHLVNDAGHCENGLYALKANYGFADLTFEKLKKFRSLGSPLTGHGEAHLFPQAVLLSNGPLGSAFPQSQGLAMADAMAGKWDRVTVTAISDGACMEGEAKEALAAIPGFAKAGKVAPFVLIISDNNTGLSGRIDKDVFSMSPTFEALSTLGWSVIDLKEGNDLQKCFDKVTEAITKARGNPQVPVVIRAKTIKGIGTEKTAQSSSGGHGFPLKSPTELPAFLKEIYSGDYPDEFDQWIQELIELEKQQKKNSPSTPVVEEKIQVGIAKAMISAKKKGLPIVSISSDLAGSTGVAGFKKEFPQCSLDVGVAESNMISTAAGFSRMGYIAVVDTFAQFGVTKGALPLTMASLSHAPVIAIFSHTGFQDAADGASHQALSYLSMVSSIPHVDAYCLTSSQEAEALMTQAIEDFQESFSEGKVPNSKVFFLGRENFRPSYGADLKYSLTKAQVVKRVNGSAPVVVIASGSCLHEAILASEKVQSSGRGMIIVNPGPHNQPDIETYKALLTETQGRVVFVEDHQKIGGLAQMTITALAENQISVKPKILAVKGEFGQSSYTAKELYQMHKIGSEEILRVVSEFKN